MYINQIDNIIDKILDELYLEGLSKDPTFRKITEGGNLNFVEYRPEINKFIQNFTENIDTSVIQTLIQNRENLARIMEIIKRYVAYYYFLSLAYYYQGTIKEFRNNLVQYSKLQENSEFTIKNFFDTENNYQIITYFKVIKDISKLILMTDLQKKTINPADYKGAISILKTLGTEYINNYLLMIIHVDNEERVVINVHNLIKTIVFGEIYRNQERSVVFEILNDIEEDEQESIFIDIVVVEDELNDYDSFRQIFLGDKNIDVLAADLFELVTATAQPAGETTVDVKNNRLVELNILTPIVDDFLRYHRDSEKLDIDSDKPMIMPLTNTSNAKNVQLALLYQQRKKKENTKAQLIINKLESISDLYSENVKHNEELQKDIKKYFQGPFSYRKAVLCNYLDEVHVMNKIINQGTRARENNEYFLELEQMNQHAYFNFKEFQRYGTKVLLTTPYAINVVRYNNIESMNQMRHLELDIHTMTDDHTAHLVGLSLGPFGSEIVQCARKEDMVDIHNITINYRRRGKVVNKKSRNGYKTFVRIIKYFLVDTITIVHEPRFELVHDFEDIKSLNPEIFDKLIYWIYDTETDVYKMETYENLKSHNFQDTIKFMNSIVHDKIMEMLTKRLQRLIHQNFELPANRMEMLIIVFNSFNKLFLKPDEEKDMFINEYLRKKPLQESKLIEYMEKESNIIPVFTPISRPETFRIKVDMINPLHLQEYIKLEAYTKEGQEFIAARADSQCQHEIEWQEILKLKNRNINEYNAAMTKFIEKFSLETINLDFVCKICAQTLPLLKEYVADGSFDNATQKFVTAYAPLDIPLEEIKGYEKYSLIIRYLDVLTNRVSLLTNTNMFVGTSQPVRQKRKALVKNVVDLLVKHNAVNLRKRQNEEERLAFFARKFNIDKDLDNVFFFELNDNIIDLNKTDSVAKELNKLKLNNILLYFILIFITELNGAQITMMSFDKIANVYTFLKYGSKLFGDLLIKKNVTDMETEPIIRYPVLCYLLFVISYNLVVKKLWAYESSGTKKFNPVYQKVIINSFVDLFNSVAIEGGKMPDEYIYLLTLNKMYSHINTTFRNNEIISILKTVHIKYSGQNIPDAILPSTLSRELLKTYAIKGATPMEGTPYNIPSYKMSPGILIDKPHSILYHGFEYDNDVTVCPYGSYHYWAPSGKGIECLLCKEKGEDHIGEINRSKELYYFDLNTIANRRCIEGTLHDFVDKDGQETCTICGRKKHTVFGVDDRLIIAENIYKDQKANAIAVKSVLEKYQKAIEEMYPHDQLDVLESNLDKLEDVDALKMMEQKAEDKRIRSQIRLGINEILAEINKEFRGDSDKNKFGQMNIVIDKLIDILEELIGADVNLDIEKYPVFLRDNIYIIDHTYNGALLPEPIILTEKDNRIMFKENQQFFKTDVYYYTDNKAQVDIFYHAVTLKLLGYKEKHKDYVLANKSSNNYLRINPSIRERLSIIGYETKYINIDEMFARNSETITDARINFYKILDGLIRDHIYKMRTSIDKFSSLMYKILNYQPPQEETPEITTHSSLKLNKLISKYSRLLGNFRMGENDDAFKDWIAIKNNFTYDKIDWEATNVVIPESMYVNSELINYYDITGTIMMYYLINQMIYILDSNKEHIEKINIGQMFIELINYVYDLYNIDAYKNSLQLKRFYYILNGSKMMIDLLRRGQGLMQSRELEESLIEEQSLEEQVNLTMGTELETEEIEDLKEEAEALDIEGDYYADTDADFVGEEDLE